MRRLQKIRIHRYLKIPMTFRLSIVALYLLVTFLSRPLSYALERVDLTYGTAAGEELKLDLFVPDGSGPLPVCVLVHGGGFERGDKQKQVKPLFAPLVKARFAWVSTSCRLSPAHKYPGSVEGLETAILWVKAHARGYCFDPSRIVLIGKSAAAYRNHEETRVAAVVPFYGPADLAVMYEAAKSKPASSFTNYFGVTGDNEAARKLLAEASPATCVRPALPPFLLLHGNADDRIAYQQSVNFLDRLKAAGVPSELITIEGGGHGMGGWGKLGSDYTAQLIAWLNKTLKPSTGLSS
jgi:alpha-L-fucosidase 2